jgi:hypothetical protein
MITLFAKVNLNLTVVKGYDDNVCQSELDCDHKGKP